MHFITLLEGYYIILCQNDYIIGRYNVLNSYSGNLLILTVAPKQFFASGDRHTEDRWDTASGLRYLSGTAGNHFPAGNVFRTVGKFDLHHHVSRYPQRISSHHSSLIAAEQKLALRAFCLTVMKVVEGNGMRGIQGRSCCAGTGTRGTTQVYFLWSLCRTQ